MAKKGVVIPLLALSDAKIVICPFPCPDSPLVLPIRAGVGWIPVPEGRQTRNVVGGNGGDCKGKLDFCDACITSLSLLPLPSWASRAEGCRGSWQLRGEVSWRILTLLSGTTSFPSEEAAAATAAAAARAKRPLFLL